GAGELALGAAFTLVSNSIERELVPKSIGCPGDFCPLIFALVDRPPTDEWVTAATRLLNRSSPRIAAWLTILAGSQVAREDSRRVPGMNPIAVGDITPDTVTS